MKIINDGLPPDVYNLIYASAGDYSRGSSDYTVTELLNPPRISILKKRHWDNIKENASDRIWSVFGTAVHYMLEKHSSDDSHTEDRYYVDILGKRIGGQIDCYNDGTLSDYKVTSAWSIVHGSKIVDWTTQLNLYAYLLYVSGKPVHKIQIIALLRDWDKHKAKYDPNYPQGAMIVVPLELWDFSFTKDWLTTRVELFNANQDSTDDNLSRCTASDMWESPTKYAVMKEGRKTAVRVLDTKEEADQYLERCDKKHYVQERRGERRRCAEYCPVSKFCNIWKEYQQNELL